MTDRLWKITATYGPDDDPMMWEEASPADVLAVVRRGVESGTIKGIETHLPITSAAPLGLSPGSYLIIPVSDGGSET